MKTIRPVWIIIAIMSLATAFAGAVRIDLDGSSAASGSGGTKNIGYVDIERVFESHPMKKRMHDEFLAEVDKLKKDQADLQTGIDAYDRIVVSSSTDAEKLRVEIAGMKDSLTNPPTAAAPIEVLLPGTTIYVQAMPKVEKSTQPVVSADMIAQKEAQLKSITAVIDAHKKDMDLKKSELSKKVRDNKDALVKLEETKTASVLEDIYRILDKMAVEENINVVIDKNNVLYGQPGQDLTDKVIERLQGR